MNHPATTPLWPCPPAAPCQHQMAVLGRARQPSQIAWPHATAMMPSDTTRLEGQSQRHEVPSRIGTSDIFRQGFHVSWLNVCVQEEISWHTSWPAKFQGWAAVGSSLPAMCQCLSDSGRASILSHLSTKLQSHPNNKGSRSGRLHGQARHWSRTV